MSNKFYAWMKTGITYKCYHKKTGLILGNVREWTDETFKAMYEGNDIGDYITQEHAVKAVEETIEMNWEG